MELQTKEISKGGNVDEDQTGKLSETTLFSKRFKKLYSYFLCDIDLHC